MPKVIFSNHVICSSFRYVSAWHCKFTSNFRCVITTIDQDQGVVTGDEPLKTLRTYRMYNGTNKCLQGSPNGLFGVCCAVVEDGAIAVGDSVYVP